jgi:hypothetical protein
MYMCIGSILQDFLGGELMTKHDTSYERDIEESLYELSLI